ncbi:hypothetical protein [Hydrogenimonas urashimensis]|uniref:hypothetical protein n=1 Tax=Hydrogenimonas urashimensis TaxID=2740515 RepID=UPI0019164313|nr:hypothetical protein [Hydrogenimonas urashimensis]
MKKIVIVLGFIVLVVILFLSLAEKPHPKIVLLGNIGQKAVEIVPNAWQCSACKMPITSQRHAGEVVTDDGKTWFFDDVGCLAGWLSDKPFREKAVVWVHTLDTKRWIDGRKAWYSVLENTPMGYGFSAYEKQGPDRIDFATMCGRMARGENLTDREYARKLLKERRHGSR